MSFRQAFDQICFWVSHQSRAQKIGTLFMEEKVKTNPLIIECF
jgi:hypothetical protein